MSQLCKVITRMSPTSSTAADYISIKTIKQARSQIEPLLLVLINQIISTTVYPKNLKLTKVIPIPKTKERTSIDGWRPINLVPSISKIVEKVLMSQIIEHLQTNNLVNHSHHGSVAGRSTQTLLLDLHDKIVEDLEEDKDVAVLLLDQSKAYNIVPHEIL